MMKFTLAKEDLLKPLQTIISVADKKHSMTILNFILCEVQNNVLTLKTSDLETEILANVKLENNFNDGIVTLPARKTVDIIRNLPNKAQIEVTQSSVSRVIIRSQMSRFTLSSLNCDLFPVMDEDTSSSMFKVSLINLSNVMKRVQFAMANNDVRYFLNGMLWEVQGDRFKAVATDGHRMASSELTIENTYLDCMQIIIPRKAVTEIQKIISTQEDSDIEVQIGKNYFKIILDGYKYTSKLIDGRYPEYTRVIPQNNNKVLITNRVDLKQALIRTSILSNEKYKGVRLKIGNNELGLSANNPECEEAEDQIEVKYTDKPMEIGFNVDYLLDSVNVLDAEDIDLYFDSPKMSLLIKDDTTKSQYVVSPIKL